jgi:peptidoglycan-associated lipoprotein
MKIARFANLVIVAVIIAAAGAGCKKGPGYMTPLPGQAGKRNTVGDLQRAPAFSDPNSTGGVNSAFDPNQPQPLMDPSEYANWTQDTEALKEYTVYFAFDSSAVRGSEKAKVAGVADYLKTHTTPRTAVKIEGHCDERGTEEYNRALGERRALSAREELISMGVEPGRIITLSLGEDRPAVQGSDESAYSRNRRAEFILLTEP